MVDQPSPPSLRDQHLEQHERNARLLEKIEQQFGKLESKLGLLEQTMIDSGWMIDPALEQRERRAAAKSRQVDDAVHDGDANMEVSDALADGSSSDSRDERKEGAPPRRGAEHTRSLRSRKPR